MSAATDLSPQERQRLQDLDPVAVFARAAEQIWWVLDSYHRHHDEDGDYLTEAQALEELEKVAAGLDRIVRAHCVPEDEGVAT